MPSIAQYIGQKYNELTIIEDAGYRQGKRQKARMVKCLCSCGNETLKNLTEVKAGRKLSCGCMVSKLHPKTHSMTHTRVWKIWRGMRQRILNPKASGYKNYGGRGITFDPAWESFETFYHDMGDPPSDAYTLDRRDSNGNYCKANCRWVTMDVQVRNRRTSVILEHDGKRLNLVDWAALLGIHPMSLRQRIDKNWPLAVALSTPKIHQNSRRSHATTCDHAGSDH
jgi:hypothetical protein